VSRWRALARTPFFAPESIAVKTIVVAWWHVRERKHYSFARARRSVTTAVQNQARARQRHNHADHGASTRTCSKAIAMTWQWHANAGLGAEWRKSTRGAVSSPGRTWCAIGYRMLSQTVTWPWRADEHPRSEPRPRAPSWWGHRRRYQGFEPEHTVTSHSPSPSARIETSWSSRSGASCGLPEDGRRTLRNDFVRTGSILSTWTLLQVQQLQGNRRRGSSLRPPMAPPPWLCPLSAGTTHHHAPMLPWTPASDVAQLSGVSLSSTVYVALRTTMPASPQRARHGRTVKVKIMRPDSLVPCSLGVVLPQASYSSIAR
jgi:hypothetical protein